MGKETLAQPRTLRKPTEAAAPTNALAERIKAAKPFTPGADAMRALDVKLPVDGILVVKGGTLKRTPSFAQSGDCSKSDCEQSSSKSQSKTC